MNLVLIGRFKKAQDAKNVEKSIEKLRTQALKDDNHSSGKSTDQRFSEDMLSLVGKLNVYTLGPSEIGQLVFDHHLRREGDRITVTTEEADVSVFVKLFIDAGAKVEVFSKHDYPSDESDRVS